MCVFVCFCIVVRLCLLYFCCFVVLHSCVVCCVFVLSYLCMFDFLYLCVCCSFVFFVCLCFLYLRQELTEQATAGWAFVLAPPGSDKTTIIAYHSPLDTSTDGSTKEGATNLSNNTGELAAILHAATYIKHNAA